MHFRTFLPSLALLTLASSGCSAPAPESSGPTGAICPEDSAVSYTNFVRGFMESYCVECHSSALRGAERQGAPLGHDFEELYGVLANGEHIDEWAGAGPDAENLLMPPKGHPAPSLEERRMLSEWFACMWSAESK